LKASASEESEIENHQICLGAEPAAKEQMETLGMA